ncbi:MAG: DNA topoisomerase (ATP-hydrolyzing) subunit A [Oscillospiraceae bacterium]|nr:DNA topoisomerase (ATP-hydrolyzing) subunit A [Oscillospiraceae bacterium]
MAKKKAPDNKSTRNPDVFGLKAEVTDQPITQTLEQNYMPYAMSVIVSRAIPEIDGFKPGHRKLLYTMYKMNLLHGARTKSANIVGQTMRLNPHGDSAIYETMVRLSKGYEALLTPFVDSKGNFGKIYSRDMAYAASRYTEAKLSSVCDELFRDIEKDTVDFTVNYDGTMNEPALLPTAFPNVLVSANMGIAVGMASQICGFNLTEVCETTIAFINDPYHDILSTLPAPDFPTGGEILYDRDEMAAVYETGRGSVKIRAKWRHIKSESLIEIYEIPYTTTAEAVIDKVSDLVKSGKIREISDMRDETDLKGLKLTMDLKRGTDPDKLMAKLFRMTPLQDSFACNFNILIAGNPRVAGVSEILTEWTAWREECVRRRVFFELTKKREKLHLLDGLKKVLLDIDRVITVIRNTELETDVIPNLMTAFKIDRLQAEYVAEIKLRNINRQYILKRLEESDELKKDAADFEDILGSRRRVKNIITDELKQIIKKYPAERKTEIVIPDEFEDNGGDENEDDYTVLVFLSREGYFKKITPLSLRMGGEQKYKENDGPLQSFEAQNKEEILVFTDAGQVYKLKLRDVDDGKASVLGVYLPSFLETDEGENITAIVRPGEYKGRLLFMFENGKAAKVELASYYTKANRKKLTGAYSDKSRLTDVILLESERDIAVFSTEGRAMIFNTSLLAPKSSRTTQGVSVLNLKAKYKLQSARPVEETAIRNLSRYRVRAVPAAGALLKEEDREEMQLSLLDE